MSMLSKENTNEIFEDIKRNLTRGVKDRKHTFHTPVFCNVDNENSICLLYTSPSPRDGLLSRMPSSA